MAKLIPAAIGLCNLTEDQTWTMTPGEIIGKIEADGKDREGLLRFFDMLNARSIAENRAVHGSKDEHPADYLILKPETETKIEVEMTPMEISLRLRTIAAKYRRP